MLAFLLANRTVAEFAGAALLCLLGWASWIHHDASQQAIGDSACEARVSVTKESAASTAAAIADAYQKSQVQPAEVAHAEAIAEIPVRVITTPIWVRSGPGEICSGAMPSLPGTAPDPADPEVGGALPGSGSGADDGGEALNARLAIEAIKVKYETALADCRRLDAEWPKPTPTP